MIWGEMFSNHPLFLEIGNTHNAHMFRRKGTAKVQSSPSSSSKFFLINLGGLSKSMSKRLSFSWMGTAPMVAGGQVARVTSRQVGWYSKCTIISRKQCRMNWQKLSKNWKKKNSSKCSISPPHLPLHSGSA